MLTNRIINKLQGSTKAISILILASRGRRGVHGTAIANHTRQIIDKQDNVPCRTCDLLGRGLISEDLDTSFTVSYAHGTGGELPHRIPRASKRRGEFHFRNLEGL